MTTEIIEIDGNLREDLGSTSTRRLRKAGRLPCIIYNEEDTTKNICIDIDIKNFEKEYYKGAIGTKIFKISVENKQYNVICYQVDLDPVSDRPRHIDFISIDGKKEIKTFVPIQYLNRDKAIGLKNGGYVNVLVRKLQIICDPQNIPSSIDVECSKLRLKQSVKISNLVLPEGVRPATKKDLMLVKVIGRGKDTIGAEGEATAQTDANTTTPAINTQPAKK